MTILQVINFERTECSKVSLQYHNVSGLDDKSRFTTCISRMSNEDTKVIKHITSLITR